MKKTILYICLFFGAVLSSLPALAQETHWDNSIFWEIRGAQHAGPSYLFGTHHLHAIEFVEQSPLIDSLLQSTDLFLGEIVIEENDLSLMQKFTSSLLMKENSLQNLLSEEDYQATDKCLRKYLGIGLTPFNNFKPIFLYQIIMVAKYMEAESDESGARPNLMESSLSSSMDGYFQKRARELNKEVQGLETIDEQFSALYDGYSLERQVDMLLEMVYDQDGSSTDEMNQLNELYVKQDLNGLLQVMESNTDPEELESLLVNRNEQWIIRLREVLKSDQNAFIAVGAGHLPGKYGLLHLLKSAGYEVRPVRIHVE